jgi:hypothetical protein
MPVVAGVLAAFLFAPACGGHSGAPGAPSDSPAAPGGSTGSASLVGMTGRAVDVFSSAPQGALSVRIESGASATTAGDGMFTLSAPAGQHTVTVTGNGVVERQTGMRAPASGAVVSLIPSAFDLAAFDEMCRSGSEGLRRWDTAPKLVVIEAVLEFTSETNATHIATAERLSGSDRDALVADLQAGLQQLSGGAFGAFSTVGVESPDAGSSVSFFIREGAVVVARFRNLRASTGSLGFGRWATRSSVTVAGAVMLDRDFDAAGGSLRRVVRVHELGHALGWGHVAARTSVMNAVVGTEPNAFDRDAARLAFQRPPGNMAPDRDPVSSSVNFHAFPLEWGPILQ